MWTGKDLNTSQLKMVCRALESIIHSAGQFKVPLTKHLHWWSILAIHSHPLLTAMDLDTLNLCLKVSRHWKLRDTTEVLAFCITAGTLQRQLSTFQPDLLRSWPDHSEILVFIANIVPYLQSNDVLLPRILPASSKALLESSMLPRKTHFPLDHYNQYLRPLSIPSATFDP